MADDRLSAELAAIRDRNEHWITRMRLTEATVRDSPFGDLRKALAALDTVLNLADEARPALTGCAPCTGRCEEGPCDCEGGRAMAWTLSPAEVREAITRALTGEADSDG